MIPLNEYSDYNIVLIDGEFYEGEIVTIQTSDGKQYRRKVKYGSDDLYITINNKKYFYSDVIYPDELQ